MSAELFVFPKGKADIDVLLELAKGWELNEVIVIGMSKEGELSVGSSEDRIPELLYLLEKAKQWLLTND